MKLDEVVKALNDAELLDQLPMEVLTKLEAVGQKKKEEGKTERLLSYREKWSAEAKKTGDTLAEVFLITGKDATYQNPETKEVWTYKGGKGIKKPDWLKGNEKKYRVREGQS